MALRGAIYVCTHVLYVRGTWDTTDRQGGALEMRLREPIVTNIMDNLGFSVRRVSIFSLAFRRLPPSPSVAFCSPPLPYVTSPLGCDAFA